MKVTNQKKEYEKGLEQKEAKAITLHPCYNESYGDKCKGKKWHLMN